VGGISLPRMIIGSNWFLGFSHTSVAQDNFIRHLQTRERVAEILAVFLEHGVDAILSGPSHALAEAIQDAQDRTGREMTWIVTPIFNILPGGPPEREPEVMFDECAALGGKICMPHQAVTDALVDRMHKKIRDIDKYTKMMRERGMIPGLSTHMPETIVYADAGGNDIETYIQLYNAAGFLMQVEVDWVMRIISQAKKPVIAIKPLAAGRLPPVVGLTYVWNTIREQDMVSVGTTTVDEAREVINISLDVLASKVPTYQLQRTRSKHSLDPGV
jgi:hypothetical protein